MLPRIMNFGRILIPNYICIFKNDEYEYYSELKKSFEYLLFLGNIRIIGLTYSNNYEQISGKK